MRIRLKQWILFLFIVVGGGLTFASVEKEDKGCDLSITRPCRSNSSLCVPLEHVDDGVLDCPDGSDEDCQDGWFVCADLSDCFEPSLYQDGIPHCLDESDEACEDWQHECLCGSPRCIDGSKVGDGILDCSEGSDELPIEKETYICPMEYEDQQEVLRKKRRALENQARRNGNSGGFTNFYSISSGVSPPLGVLTSTVFSFVNRGTTSEYLTHVKGTSIDGSYAQVTSISSRTFFALPTRIKGHQVNGLVSSLIRTTVSDGYSQTIVSRIYHTTIDGTYAQLVETETKGVSPSSVNYITILQGEELHGTFLSHPDQSVATLQFSHLEGSLNPTPVAEEVVTVTGTYGKFIRNGLGSDATYSVFTGSYVKDHKTYMFFFGNSALPSQMKQTNDNGKIILDMEKDMKVLMPSQLKIKNIDSKDDFLVGEGMIDGLKMDGLFIADSKGFDVKGARIKDGGDVKMLTVTIGKPSTVIMDDQKEKATKGTLNDQDIVTSVFQPENEKENEIDPTLFRGRKAHFNEDVIVEDINPTHPLPVHLPTFVIEEPNQNIGDILEREKLFIRSYPSPSVQIEDENVVDNLKAKFKDISIDDLGIGDSELPTVTYYGFAEFTTTIADTVVVFSPHSEKEKVVQETSTSTNLQPRLKSSASTGFENLLPSSTKADTFSTVTTKVFNTVDLYPSGLVSSIAGTAVNEGMTTLFTTLVYGTYIEGQYAQIVRSTSSIFFDDLAATSTLSPTQILDTAISKTMTLEDEKDQLLSLSKTDTKENVFDSFLNEIQENAIARSVSGSTDKNINILADVNEKDPNQEVPLTSENISTSTYTLYTTFVEDGTTIVTTNVKTTVLSPSFKTITELKPSTITTSVEDIQSIFESSNVQPNDDLVPSSVLFFNILDPELPFETTLNENKEIITESTTDLPFEEITETPGFSLESSLNPDENVDALYFPRTYYTTYTYFTTYHKMNTSSIISSLETITNVITDENDLEKYKSLPQSVHSYPVTYWTTYTYWTTLVKDNSSITTSSKETVSSVVHLTATDLVPLVSTENPETTPILPLNDSFTRDSTTYYTTYTYYTTATIGESTIVSTRLETLSNIVTETSEKESIEPFGLLFDVPVTSTTSSLAANLFDPFHDILTEDITEKENTQFDSFGNLFDADYSEVENIPTATSVTPTDLKTGLLSTIRRSSVNDGTTTILSTNIYGSYVDGLYVQIQSTKTEILDNMVKTSIPTETGVVTVNAGSIIENGITTHYTTQHIIQFTNGEVIKELLSTSRIETKPEKSDVTGTTKAGRVKEIIGSIIHDTKTTYYHSTVYGTVIGGIYAQKVDSTSRIVTGPSISFNVLTETTAVPNQIVNTISPIIESSIKQPINPTPVIVPTQILDLESEKNEESDQKSDISPKPKNRLSFPIRTTRRRTDAFQFIKRTSIFQKQEALSKVLAAPSLTTETTTPEPETTTTPKAEEKTLRPFRFGAANSQRPFRFAGKDSKKKVDPVPNLRRDKNIPNKPVKKPVTQTEKTVEKPIPEEESETFRQFRFREKTPTTGTRSTLPIARKARPSPAETSQSQSNRFRFGLLPETTTKSTKKKLPEIATTTTTAVEEETEKPKRRTPFAFLGRPISEKRKTSNIKKPEKEQPSKIQRPSLAKERPSKRPSRPHPRPGGLSSRRRPLTPGLSKAETEISPVYVNPDGSPAEIGYEDIEIISFTPEDAIDETVLHRKKRQVDFGRRMSSRGTRRFPGKQENIDTENIAPSPSIPKKTVEPFTLSNPRSLRLRSRVRDNNNNENKNNNENNNENNKNNNVQKQIASRTTIPRISKSRNTLPFRPRRLPSSPTTAPKQSFRRPSSDSRLKVSNRFTPRNKNKETVPEEKSIISRRPSKFTSQRSRSPPRNPPSNKNPSKSFLSRPKPISTPKPKPDLIPIEDGKFEIMGALTVTREVPVTTTIPLIEDGQTIEKKVITASFTTETIQPDQITQTEINGEVKLLLSTEVSEQKVTQLFIQPIPTTLVTYTTEFIDGLRTSSSIILPQTFYSIVTVTASANENGVQDLLKLLFLQQQQQNPLLAALGLNNNKPSVHLETKTFVTTVTSFTSTEIPIIFRGKPIRTTVVETNTVVVTTTEVITKTLSGSESMSNPLVNPNPFGGLLPLLLQNQLNRKAREVSPTLLALNNDEKTNSKVEIENLSPLESKDEIDILPAFNEVEVISTNYPTPPLLLNDDNTLHERRSFLSKGPAELTPLKRTVRSAQRGNILRQRQRNRNFGGRRINDFNEEENVIPDQIPIDTELDNLHLSKNANIENNKVLEGPATYYTTFTYYTTYLDDQDREIIKSSEDTITQIATFGNILLDDFTKVDPTQVLNMLQTSIAIQENFTLEDAIIPGKPRPVPVPVFKDPMPPHGPVISHRGVKPLSQSRIIPSNKIKFSPRIRIKSNSRRRDNLSENSENLLPDSPTSESSVDEMSIQSHINEDNQRPSNRRRFRVFTKKRPIDPNTKTLKDEGITEFHNTREGAINLHNSQVQVSSIEPPVSSVTETVSTLYTLYYYTYSIVSSDIPVSSSTRVETVSNSIIPTVITIPKLHQTLSSPLDLYTIEKGEGTSKLEDQIQDDLTTKIYLSSATLVNFHPMTNADQIFEERLDNDKALSLLDTNAGTLPPSINLQSSLKEEKVLLTTTTPTIPRLNTRRNHRGRLRGSNQQINTEKTAEPVSSVIVSHENRVRNRGRIRASVAPAPRRTIQSLPTSVTRRNRFRFRNRDQLSKSMTEKTIPIIQEKETILEIPILENDGVEEAAEKSEAVLPLDLFSNIIGGITEPPQTTPFQSIDEEDYPIDVTENISQISEVTSSPFDLFSNENISQISEVSSSPFDLFSNIIEETTELTETTTTASTTITTDTPQTTTKSQRPQVRRDDIPILRRPSNEPRNLTLHRLRFKTTTPNPDARAVFGNGAFEQSLPFQPSQKPVGILLNIDARQNLATKVMNNGVEVIVAEDKTLQQEIPQGNTFLDRPKPQGLPPITLPPSTLSNQMLLFASPTDKNKGETAMDEHDLMFHYKTYFTTLTYYNTILQDGFPVVRTSKETISNLVSAPIYVSGKFVEKTKINLETSTYLATQTFTKTVGDRLHPEIITSKEVITQVVVTEVPSIQRTKIDITPSLITLVTKTFFTTFTYYKTYDGGHVETETAVSSDIVTVQISDTRQTTLPVVSLTKLPTAISHESNPIELFATKTYYTTSTYLTTILQGDQTVTSSHIEITSNIVTEPITSMVLNTEQIPIPENDYNDKFEDVHYVPINENVYKEIKTLYAIYTHFTTLHNGRVKSSEVTKTQLLTATITTNSIPASLIIQPDQSTHSLKTADPTQPEEIFNDYYYDETGIELDPSYIDTLSIQTPTESLRDTNPSDIKEVSNLKATVHIKEENTADDTFVVEDSTTKATILVRPTIEAVDLQSDNVNLNVLASSQLSLVEISTSPSFNFSEILSDTIKPSNAAPVVTTSITEDPSLEEISNSADPHLHSVVPDETLPDQFHKSNSSLQAESENEESTFNIGLSPMLTAVAGLIGNTFTGKLAGQTHGARRKIDHPILPKNAIVAAEREPLFIPIGGVGASISSSRDSTLHPEQGFIPLLRENPSDNFQVIEEENQRHDMPSISDSKHPTPVEEVGGSIVQPEEGFIPLIIKDSEDEFLTYEDEPTRDDVIIPDPETDVLLEESKPTLDPSIPEPISPVSLEKFKPALEPVILEPVSPVSIEMFNPSLDSSIVEPIPPVSLEKFGPSFKPPTQTESGFTGMTPDKVNPTRVSVISGEETIFFGGFGPQNPPSEEPSLSDSIDILEQAQSSPVHVIIDDNNQVRPHILQPSNGNDEGYDFRPVIKPGTDNLGNEYYYYADYGSLKDEQYPDYDVDNQDSGISNVLSSIPILTSINGNKATTLVLGSSTILSGATTVFDNLFTKPADSLNVNEYYGNIEKAVDDRFHDIMMHLSKSKLSSTQTKYDKIQEPTETSIETSVTESSVKTNLRTLVPSVTQITLISSTKTTETISYSTDTQTQIINTKSEQSLDNHSSTTKFNEQTDDSTTQSTEEISENEVNLAYEEQNEVNRVIESKNPHQVLENPQSTVTCNQECSENEICKVFRQEHVCICKPGYSRRNPTDDCRKSESYEVRIVLEKLSDNTLLFSSELKNKSNPNTQFLMKEINSGIEKAMMNSDLSDKYYSNVIIDFDRVQEKEEKPSLLAKVKIDIEKDEDVLSGSFITVGEPTNDVAVQAALEGSLQHSNYSLGGGAVYARKEPSSVLAATDFDECSFEEHNDCHENARCINLVGTFKCECEEGFQDLFAEEELESGRQCVQSKTCSFCNYNGWCQISLSEGTTCICNDWFSGKTCNINLKVMLISVVSVGSFLLLVFCILAAFCCCRKKKKSQGGLLGNSSHGKVSTLDRRAMIHDTSSESSDDFTRHRSGTIVDDSLPPMPSTPQADYSLGKKSGISLTSKDRSMTVHTSIPPVYIPRVKSYNSTSTRAYTLERNPNSKFNYNTNPKTKEEALVEVLEGSNRYNRSQEDLRSRENVLSVHSYATTQRPRSRDPNDSQYQKPNYHHTSRENQESMDTFKTRARSTSRAKEQFLSEMRSRSVDRLDEERVQNNMHSDMEEHSLRYGNRTESQARSYDETTVRPPIRSLHAESYRSRAVSSQLFSDGLPTNAERDGNSTIVYPQMQLYKPLMEADSISDLTGHHKSSWE